MKKEVLIYNSSAESLNIVGGKINSVRFNQETRNTVRVYDDGKIAVVGKLGDADFKEMYDEACKKFNVEGIPYAYLPSKKTVKSIARRKAYSSEKLLKAGKSLMAKAAKECPGFLIGGKMEYAEYSGQYVNSEGSNLSYEGSAVSVGLQLKDKASSNIMDAFYGVTFPLYGKTAADAVVTDLKMLHDAFFTEKKPLKNGKYNVIVDSGDLFNLLASSFIAENYVAGGSVLSGKLGQKIFNENLSVYVDRNPSTNYGCAFYDGEGTVMPDYRTPLILNGVMKNVLANKNTAKLYDLPHGGVSGSTYDGVPSIAVTGLYTKPSDITLKELTKDEPAIYIAVSSGGDMTNDGVIGLPVMLAFLVENGKISGRVSEFNATGSIFDILGKDFVAVSKDNLFTAEKSGMIVVKADLIAG